MSSQSSSIVSRRRARSTSRAPTSMAKRRFISSARFLVRNRPTFTRLRGMNGDLRTYSFTQKVSVLNNTSQLGAASGFVNGTATNDAYVIGANTGTPATPAYVSGGMQFQLADLDQLASFQALFEQFRINLIQVQFIPLFNESAIGQGTSLGQRAGELYVMHDFEDTTAPTDLTVLRQRQDTQVAASYQPLTINIKPRCDIYAINGSASTAAATSVTAPWLQTSSVGSTISHFGLKYAIANMGDTVVPKWIVRIKFYLQFRNIS